MFCAFWLTKSSAQIPMKASTSFSCSMKKSHPCGGIEVSIKRQRSVRARECKQRFTNNLLNYTLPDGIYPSSQEVWGINDILPEEILFHHIFVRLSPKTLILCKSVCKAVLSVTLNSLNTT